MHEFKRTIKIVLSIKLSYSIQLVQYDLAKNLGKHVIIRANRVEKSPKIIERTCSSIRDLRALTSLSTHLMRL